MKINQNDVENRKQERKARIWAYEKMITFDVLISAFESGCRNRYEIAEFLGVTEDFLTDSILAFSQKHGMAYRYKDYTLIFNGGLSIVKELQ